MGEVGRKRKFVRVEYDANGEPHVVEEGGTEIDGLSFDASKTVKCFYTRIAGETKKTGLGRNLQKAIEAVSAEKDEPAQLTVKFQLPPTSLNEWLANSETSGEKLAAARAVFMVHPGIPGNADRVLRKKYWSSRDPYAMRLMTLILLLIPSNRLVCSGYAPSISSRFSRMNQKQERGQTPQTAANRARSTTSSRMRKAFRWPFD